MFSTHMAYDEFMEHVAATGSSVTREGPISTAVGDYCGRECLIGTYNHDTGAATLHCV